LAKNFAYKERDFTGIYPLSKWGNLTTGFFKGPGIFPEKIAFVFQGVFGDFQTVETPFGALQAKRV
jgi:hypothetical protein